MGKVSAGAADKGQRDAGGAHSAFIHFVTAVRSEKISLLGLTNLLAFFHHSGEDWVGTERTKRKRSKENQREVITVFISLSATRSFTEPPGSRNYFVVSKYWNEVNGI